MIPFKDSLEKSKTSIGTQNRSLIARSGERGDGLNTKVRREQILRVMELFCKCWTHIPMHLSTPGGLHATKREH